MLARRWTYSNPRGLTQWYGHVDYFGPYVIGQWFVLDAVSGREHWSRRWSRPNTVCGCAQDVIVATEMRSDGPWTATFGIYGIDARTGTLQWTAHAREPLGRLLRCFDFVPGFTNEFRDGPERVVGRHVVTVRGRTLDVRTGRESLSANVADLEDDAGSTAAERLYANKWLDVDGDTLRVSSDPGDFVVSRHDPGGGEVWRFAAGERSFRVNGNYYSYRLHQGCIYIVLSVASARASADGGDAPPSEGHAADHQLGVLDVFSGKCALLPLPWASGRKACRIEAMRGSRMLLSCDGTELAEFELPACRRWNVPRRRSA